MLMLCVVVVVLAAPSFLKNSIAACACVLCVCVCVCVCGNIFMSLCVRVCVPGRRLWLCGV